MFSLFIQTTCFAPVFDVTVDLHLRPRPRSCQAPAEIMKCLKCSRLKGWSRFGPYSWSNLLFLTWIVVVCSIVWRADGHKLNLCVISEQTGLSITQIHTNISSPRLDCSSYNTLEKVKGFHPTSLDSRLCNRPEEHLLYNVLPLCFQSKTLIPEKYLM